jgi:hypothetical protein
MVNTVSTLNISFVTDRHAPQLLKYVHERHMYDTGHTGRHKVMIYTGYFQATIKSFSDVKRQLRL